MRQRAIIISCLALAFVILAGCIFMQAGVSSGANQKTTQASTTAQPTTQETSDSSTEDSTATTEQPQPVFLHTAQENEPGASKSFTQHNENYAYGVLYPSIGNETVDGQIEAFAKSITDGFDESAAGFVAGPSRERAIMRADYKVYISTNAAQDVPGSYNLLSVVFEISPGVFGSGARGTKIATLLFDLNTGRRLMPAEVFGADYPAVIAGKAVAAFAGNAEYAAQMNTEIFTVNTAPIAENFLNVAFIQGQAVFYFDAGRILPENFGCVSAAIPVTELYQVLRIRVSERAPFRMFGTEEKMIALTFDDGPRAEKTARLLDALDKVGGRATFLVLGMMIDKAPDMVKRAHLAGSDIENHSYDHKKMLPTMSEADILFQLTECDNKIINITGVRPTFFRIPYGFNNTNADRLADRPIIGWGFDTTDWMYSDTKKKNRTPAERDADKQKIIDRTLEKVQDGDIVLMHDIHLFTIEVCEALIPEFAARGFQLVTVNELFSARGIKPVNGQHYSNARR
ncbi:MAG: polysaccharide deacetylase family protein [Clostridiales bacterium]|nr:polysaccharide deacetylase family protein [Clostridiales bacterium]